MTAILEPSVRRDVVPPDLTRLQAEASSAHKRINIPLNLENWKLLPADQVEQLTWFHQYILEEGLGFDAVEQALDYDASTVFRVLKGTYEGNWENIVRAIKSWRKLVALRGTVQTANFAHNRITRRMFWLLDYTLARAGTALVLGQGGIGKTICAKAWCNDNNHGRAVFVECLPIGGAKGLLRQVAEKIGVNKNQNTSQMIEAVVRGFNSTRLLIVDEIQHHVPSDARSKPLGIELLRRIKDLSGCGLAMIGTEGVATDMRRAPNFYEQVIRRAGKPFYLQNLFEASDVEPIIRQFVKRPGDHFLETMLAWANDREIGRLGYVTETLSYASRLASAAKKPLTEEIVYAAHNLREKQSRAAKPKDQT